MKKSIRNGMCFIILGSIFVGNTYALEKRKEITIDMGGNYNGLRAILYREPSSELVCGEGNFELTVKIEKDGKAYYSYSKENNYDTHHSNCWANDDLIVKDVTNDKIPELLFKSCYYTGRGDRVDEMHIVKPLSYKNESGLVDIKNIGFGDPIWVEVDGTIYAVRTELLNYKYDPSAFRTTTVDSRYFQIIAYRWDSQSENFIISHVVRSLEPSGNGYGATVEKMDLKNIVSKIKTCPN